MPKYKLILNEMQVDVLRYAIRSWNHLVNGRYKNIFYVFRLSTAGREQLKTIFDNLPTPSDEKIKKYHINLDVKRDLVLDETEYDRLVTALDFYSRIYLTQFQEITWYCYAFFGLDVPEDMFQKLNNFKLTQFGFTIGAGYGMGSKELNRNANIAWDIQQIIRHRLAWDRNPQGGMTVNFHSPMRWSSQPLPTIEMVKDQ